MLTRNVSHLFFQVFAAGLAQLPEEIRERIQHEQYRD